MPSPLAESRPRPAPPAAPGTAAAARSLDLDAIRGVAILLAMGWHFNHGDSGNAVLDVLQWPGRTFGWAGVDLFFVLSGFLVGRLVLGEHRRTGRFDGRRFALRRALKLWPVLYVFLVIHAFAGAEPWNSYLWQNALHVQNYAGTSLSHLWSLAVEEHFYLALVLLIPLLVRLRTPPGVLAAVLGGLLVAAPLLRWHAAVSGVGDLAIQWQSHLRMDSLAAGVLLAALSVYWPEVMDRALRHRGLWAVLAAAGTGWLVTIGVRGTLGLTLGYSVAYLTGAAFLLTLYRARWLSRLRRPAQGLAALGRYSYGIYIWHLFAAQLVTGWLPGMGFRTMTPAAQLAKYAAAIALGVLATLAVERPMLRLRDRLVPAGATGAAAAPRALPAVPEAERGPAAVAVAA
jgi:peptidoglycan/LPS O-acetylase OafA/YrhL